MPIIIANWKMNFTLRETFEFCNNLSKTAFLKNIVICPPAPYLGSLAQSFDQINFGSQNISHFESYGAYTGEYCASMLKSCGINYSIVGHSERRALFSETNEIIQQKALRCLEHNITPIICIGESLEARQSNEHIKFIRQQLIESLPVIDKEMILAYEPIWSINTGLIPSAKQLSEAIDSIGSILEELSVAKTVSVVYGGSVNKGNIEQILSLKNISGALIGGASLNYNDLVKILSATHKIL